MSNPLLSDRDVSFHLYEVLDAASLLSLAHFADHSLETFDAYIGVCRRFAREAVFPAFRAVDEDPPKLVDGRVIVHERLHGIYKKMRELDRAKHASTEPERRHAQLLLDLLTPMAKSFLAERGFESNALALQIHGGYGYTSEFLPEAWLRDQKLNSIHEGTTGIQGLVLLGRKVMASGGAALAALQKEVSSACRRAESAGVEPLLVSAVEGAGASAAALTQELAVRGRSGDVEGMLRHSADFLELFSTYVISWHWLLQAAAAREALSRVGGSRDFYEGKLAAAQYWIRTELPKNEALVAVCRENEDSYARMRPGWF